MMKKKTSEVPKKQLKPPPPQQPNALKTQLPAPRPSLQQRHSQPKLPLQLSPSDDLLRDVLRHERDTESPQNMAQQIKAMQAPSAAQQHPLGTSQAAAGKAQSTAESVPHPNSLLAAKEASKAAGMPVKSASQQEPPNLSETRPANDTPHQEPQQSSGGMLLSITEESVLNTDVPAASEPSHIGSMDGADPLFEQYDELLREELQHQVGPAGPDHRPQPESITLQGDRNQQAHLAKATIQQLPQNVFGEPNSAEQIVSDAPSQTLPDPVPGLQAPPAAPAPALPVSPCRHPCQFCAVAGLSVRPGSVAAAALSPFSQMYMCSWCMNSARIPELDFETWHVMSPAHTSLCKPGGR